MAERIYTNVVGLKKASESFVFCFEDEDSEAVIAAFARFATNPELNFSWADAAVLIRRVASLQESAGLGSETSRFSRQSSFEERKQWGKDSE